LVPQGFVGGLAIGTDLSLARVKRENIEHSKPDHVEIDSPRPGC
jgi:hypothetical protein